jgi:hypothetical protein
MARRITLAAFAATLLCALGTSAAPAETFKEVDSFVEFNDCNGDVISLDVTTHALIKPQNDGTIIIKVTLVGAGVATSGNEYIFHQQNSLVIFGTDPKFEIDVLLVSKGAEPNQSVTYRFNFDTNMLEVESQCKG